MIRILLVDSQNVAKPGIQALLEPKPKLKVVGTAKDGNSAIKQVDTLMPDIVLVDIEMSGMDGLSATQKICQRFPQTQVIVINGSSYESGRYAAKAIQAGAEAYLLKSIKAEDFEQAILSIYQGRSQAEKQLPQKTLSKVHTDANEELNNSNKHLPGNGESKEISLSVSSSKIGNITKKPVLVTVSILLIMAVTLVRFLNILKPQASDVSEPVRTKLPEIKKVAAIGRIEPLGEVISLSAPTSLEGVQVEQLRVQIGDYVKKGQIIAILDRRKRQQAALSEAKTQYEVARSRLERVKAGAKQGTIRAKQAAIANIEAQLVGEIQTQQATVAKLAAKLDNARTEWKRNQQLYIEGAISASNLDSKKLTLKIAQEQLNEAKAIRNRTQRTLEAKLAEAEATLEETAEVRPIDVQIAQAELKQARAAVAKAQADMELAYVRAPVDAEILNIHTRPGEAISEKGIVAIGQTEQMMIVAEIDQNDINRVKIGQRAKITSNVFLNQLYGKVHEVGSLISKNDILDTDPAADEDSRVVEVQILLEPKDSQKVAKLTNLEVDVVIEL